MTHISYESKVLSEELGVTVKRIKRVMPKVYDLVNSRGNIKEIGESKDSKLAYKIYLEKKKYLTIVY